MRKAACFFPGKEGIPGKVPSAWRGFPGLTRGHPLVCGLGVGTGTGHPVFQAG